MIDGILLISKPAGMTSHDVVAKARKLLKTKRIGHTGTLDPQVTGVLPLCIGRATRLVEYIQELPKEYVATLTVGYSTDTEDQTGNTRESVSEVDLSESQVIKVLNSFRGQIEQIPPMYSAVKVQGKRLYELAREGLEVERSPRQVTIYEIECLNMNLEQEFPEITFRVRCSKGTYIRTLCTDIGKGLRYPAVMSSLVRTRTGLFTLEQCHTLEHIGKLAEAGQIGEALLPLDQGVLHMTSVVVQQREASKALLGQKLNLSLDWPPYLTSDEEIVRLYSQANDFIGLFKVGLQSCELIPVKVFN